MRKDFQQYKSPSECPVVLETYAIEARGKEIIHSMRRVRRSLKACVRCELQESCPFLQEFNQTVEALIYQLGETWKNGEAKNGGLHVG